MTPACAVRSKQDMKDCQKQGPISYLQCRHYRHRTLHVTVRPGKYIPGSLPSHCDVFVGNLSEVLQNFSGPMTHCTQGCR